MSGGEDPSEKPLYFYEDSGSAFTMMPPTLLKHMVSAWQRACGPYAAHGCHANLVTLVFILAELERSKFAFGLLGNSW